MRGDPGSGRPIQCITKYEPRRLSWLVFTIYPSIPTEVILTTRTKRQCETTTTPEPPTTSEFTTTPPPFFYLPRIQTRAEGGFFNGFNAASTASTFPTSKREPDVDLSGVSTCLVPPPPPLHPNASWSWTFQRFQSCCHRFHPPRVQMRAGSEFLWRFDATLRGYSSHSIQHQRRRGGVKPTHHRV